LRAERRRPSEWRDRDSDAGHAVMAYQPLFEERYSTFKPIAPGA